MSKIADPRVLKDHELDAVAGGFQTVSTVLKVRDEAAKASISRMR